QPTISKLSLFGISGIGMTYFLIHRELRKRKSTLEDSGNELKTSKKCRDSSHSGLVLVLLAALLPEDMLLLRGWRRLEWECVDLVHCGHCYLRVLQRRNVRINILVCVL
ncbi:hypothetical protein PENTCL1PPCAC_10101, partial [Pristionchus entomophagus]